MPEVTECTVACLYLGNFLNAQPQEALLLRRLWVDATGKERRIFLEDSPNHPGAHGLVYELESTSEIKRGPGTSKEDTDTDTDADTDTYVKPKPKPKPKPKSKSKPKPKFRFKGQKDEPEPEPEDELGRLPVFPTVERYKGKGPIAAHELALQDVEVCHRNVILLFVDKDSNALWSQISFYTHSFPQILTKRVWEESICVVSRQDRGFKVGLAFEFRDYVVAFLSLNLNIKFSWADSRSKLTWQQPDVYLKFEQFLEKVARWNTTRRNDKNLDRSGNAMLIVKDTVEFSGIGLYSVSEVFFAAARMLTGRFISSPGIPVHISEPRLCEAIWMLSRRARVDSCHVRKLFQRYIEPDYSVAISTDERLRYSRLLHVFGKDHVHFTPRFKALLQEYTASVSARQKPAYDVFEPHFLHDAITRPNHNNGLLIFGKEWPAIRSANNLPPSGGLEHSNPLIRHFLGTHTVEEQIKGLAMPLAWHVHTLKSSAYHKPLFYQPSNPVNGPASELDDTAKKNPLRAHHTDTLVYRLEYGTKSAFNAWTVMPYFNSGKISPAHPYYMNILEKKKKGGQVFVNSLTTQYVDSGRKDLLGKTITQYSAKYSVGPLDFCGVARIVKNGKERVVLHCNMDPTVNPFYVERHVYSGEVAKLRGKGLEKEGLPAATLKAVQTKLGKRPITAVEQENMAEKPSKRMRKSNRKSQDQKLYKLRITAYDIWETMDTDLVVYSPPPSCCGICNFALFYLMNVNEQDPSWTQDYHARWLPATIIRTDGHPNTSDPHLEDWPKVAAFTTLSPHPLDGPMIFFLKHRAWLAAKGILDLKALRLSVSVLLLVPGHLKRSETRRQESWANGWIEVCRNLKVALGRELELTVATQATGPTHRVRADISDGLRLALGQLRSQTESAWHRGVVSILRYEWSFHRWSGTSLRVHEVQRLNPQVLIVIVFCTIFGSVEHRSGPRKAGADKEFDKEFESSFLDSVGFDDAGGGSGIEEVFPEKVHEGQEDMTTHNHAFGFCSSLGSRGVVVLGGVEVPVTFETVQELEVDYPFHYWFLIGFDNETTTQ
ncbi:hypothetical protein BDN72DRAFT_864033 [Pluteus cervinus]|uniref:Uncharacterized protein n=1 Tax=Pluteus cervinus TaxID=181527 RepID=A0ACD3A662_9AGAR|nr:hypothetical protein BDN72DRAFT_864033 [Pluteus cervinus]